MDTGTHFAVGLGLAGLAHLDPAVAADPTLSVAVGAGAVLGSQAPDLDGLLRLKGNAAYIKNHRGASHSLPAVLLWTIGITALLLMIFPEASLPHVAGWTGFAVLLHVFSDLFNTYGTQALRPFSERWIAWSIIHIFDPFIFTLHVVAVLLWFSGFAEPAVIFPAMYVILIVYYISRTYVHFKLLKKIHQTDGDYRKGDSYLLIPTVHPAQWNVVKKRPDHSFVLGEWKHGSLQWVDEARSSDHPAVEASRRHPDIAAFLYYSSYACAEVKRHRFGYEVRWIDVRYRHRKQYPFLAVCLLDEELRPFDSYVGWSSDQRVDKKLGLDTTY